MSAYSDALTIRQAQVNQPWTVPYSEGVERAAGGDPDTHPSKQAPAVPHILGSHCALHAIKSLGKIAAVYEARDHDDSIAAARGYGVHEIRKMAADLMTAALRFANLEGFDLAEALVERVREKNGADFGPVSNGHRAIQPVRP
jgi:hypothetical protein